jgi:carnitine-CoA ligase
VTRLGHDRSVAANSVLPRGEDSVTSVLREQAARDPDRPFLIYERAPGRVEKISWAEQTARAARTAGALHRRGVWRGTRFNVHLTNCPEFYDLWLGAALLGATMVPTDPRFTAAELAYVIEHAGCRLSVTQPGLRAVAAEAAGPVPVVSIDEAWIQPDDHAPPGSDPAPDDVLSVLYAPAATSQPQAVLVTHAAHLQAGDVVARHLRLGPGDRNLITLPLSEGDAQYYSTMSSLVTGAPIALARRFSARRWAEQATALGAAVTSLSAAQIRMILAQPPGPLDTAHRLRGALFTQGLTGDQVAGFEQRFAVQLMPLHGMAETVRADPDGYLYFVDRVPSELLALSGRPRLRRGGGQYPRWPPPRHL